MKTRRERNEDEDEDEKEMTATRSDTSLANLRECQNV